MADITWRENFNGFIPEADWLSVGFQVSRPNDPIDGLFADQKTDNLVAQWQTIAAEYQRPFMAHFHGFDTEANTTFRIPVDTKNIEKGLIKVKLNQSERLRELMRAGVHGDAAIYDYVMNDGLRLADGVVTRTKVAKNELMATGQVTIKENNLDLTVDYGVPGANLSHVIDVGDGEDVPGQIQAIIDAATANGVTINGMLTSRRIISKMRRNKSIQQAINGNLGIGALVSNTALNAYLADEFGINMVIVNDLTYISDAVIGNNGRPSVTSKRYYPDNKISFFGTNNGRLGVGLWGNPPEADASRFYAISGSGVSPYVYLMQWMETDPAVLWTKASALFMPVLYNPDALYVATVVETPYSITVKPSKATVAVSATKQLNATTVPSGATVSWSTSASDYATVSNSGLVTGVASGSAVITASITDGVSTYEDVCNVTVS